MVIDKFKKRFSIGHPDMANAGEEHPFFHLFSNTSQDFKDEIEDIYFGTAFYYNFNGNLCRYGEVMGKEANEIQINRLLKIQEKFGVKISLTINQTVPPPEIVGHKVIRDAFVAYIKSFYDVGIRSATISNVHLMATGILQETFPEMHWKNTVNHMVKTPQDLINYAHLGYKTILLDRSLNRDIETLKEIKKVAQQYDVKTSLLASEGCIPSCPFKIEHDFYQARFLKGEIPIINSNKKEDYWTAYADLSCNECRTLKKNSKFDETMPRTGINVISSTKETLDIILDNVDYLKYSGRLANPGDIGEYKDKCLAWGIDNGNNNIFFETFSDVYTNVDDCFHYWKTSPIKKSSLGCVDDSIMRDAYYNWISDSVWLTEEGRKLDKNLRNCKSQCYKCHMCEKVFGEKIKDSIIKVDDGSWIKTTDTEISQENS